MGIPPQLLNQVRDTYGQKIADKFDFTIEHARSFVAKHFPEDDKFHTAVSGDQLGDVVLNYFVDIQRFKERRGMVEDQVSGGKIASFTAKWLVKFKPLLVMPANDDPVSTETAFMARHVNEIFAVSHIEKILGKPLPKKLFQELILEFRQKKFSETQLYMTLERHIDYYAY